MKIAVVSDCFEFTISCEAACEIINREFYFKLNLDALTHFAILLVKSNFQISTLKPENKSQMNNRIHREVIGGHLLVIGGAEDKYNERRILRKFLSLAGGDDAEILIVPVASDFPEFAADVYVQAFRNLGVANPRVLRATSRQDVFEARCR